MPAGSSPSVVGHVSQGFEAVRGVFVDNFAHARSWVAPAVPITAARRSSTSGAASGTSRPASPGSEDTMAIVYSATKGLAAMTLASRTPAAGSITKTRLHVLAGVRATRERADHRPPAPGTPGWAVRARRARRPRAWSPISIGWRSCWPARNPRGNRARARRITPSPSDSTKASCCAGSIRGTAAWGSSSRMRSPRRSSWTSTSGCPRTSRTRGWRRMSRPALVELLRASRSAWRSTR